MADLHTMSAYMAGSKTGYWQDIEDTPLYQLAAAVLMSDFDNWNRDEDTITKCKREVGIIAEWLKDDAGLRRAAAAVVLMALTTSYRGKGFLGGDEVRLDPNGKPDTMINFINRLADPQR
jgi:hypothetical protein